MRARLVLLAVVVVGAIGLWWLRPRTEENRLLTLEEAQAKANFRIRTPERLPAETILLGVRVQVPKRMAGHKAVSPSRQIQSPFWTPWGEISWRFDERQCRAVIQSLQQMPGRSPVEEQKDLKRFKVQPGDYLLKVNQQPVRLKSAADFEALMNRMKREYDEGKLVDITIMTRRGPFTWANMSKVNMAFIAHRLSPEALGRLTSSPQPTPPQPLVALLYQRRGRNFTLFQERVSPGATIRWAGTVVREGIDINGHKATLRSIGGHLALTWSDGEVEFQLSDHQNALSADELIDLARSLK